MEIEFKDVKQFGRKELERLFRSVRWSSGRYPDKLVRAMLNYDAVFSAWDGQRLVGMACALDDGVMTAYVHYLLVDPAYQGQGIGRMLLNLVKNRYEGYLRIALTAYADKQIFYERCGFKPGADELPMFITELED